MYNTVKPHNSIKRLPPLKYFLKEGKDKIEFNMIWGFTMILTK